MLIVFLYLLPYVKCVMELQSVFQTLMVAFQQILG